MKKPKNYGHCPQLPSHVQDAEIIQPMYGKFKQEEATSLQHSSSDAQNAVIHSENTHKPAENVKVLTFLNDWAKPY